jgi:hypothetical protein
VIEWKHDELRVRIVAQALGLESDGLPRVGYHVLVSEGNTLGHAGRTLEPSQHPSRYKRRG